MTITVFYHAQVRRAAGVASERIELEAPIPLGELLKRLAEEHGEALRDILIENELPSESLLLFVGDEQVRADSNRVLSDGDRLDILSPISGG